MSLDLLEELSLLRNYTLECLLEVRLSCGIASGGIKDCGFWELSMVRCSYPKRETQHTAEARRARVAALAERAIVVI